MVEEIVWACPFCRVPVWFGRVEELRLHIFMDHREQFLVKALDRLCAGCKTQVRKEMGRWMEA